MIIVNIIMIYDIHLICLPHFEDNFLLRWRAILLWFINSSNS
jgi:hypothetical protein